MFANKIGKQILLLGKSTAKQVLLKQCVRCASSINVKSHAPIPQAFIRSKTSAQPAIQKASDANEFYAQLIKNILIIQKNTPKTPMELYQSMIVNGELKKDAYQLTIVRKLQSLYDNIVNYYTNSEISNYSQISHEILKEEEEKEEKPKETKSSWFSFGKTKKEEKPIVFHASTPSTKTPKGAYIWGDPGSGKSMMMDLLFDTIPATIPKKRVHFHAFMLDIHQRLHAYRQIHGARSDPLPQIAREIGTEIKVLCFDEFQVTDVADAMMLQRLFTELFNNDICIIATSNRCPDDLYKDGVQRDRFIPFIDLLKVDCPEIYINSGKDYRYGGVKEMQTYYYPINNSNINTIKEILTGINGQPLNWKSEEIEVIQGRTLHVPKADNGICVFDFHDLCQEALGAADYLSLCANYHTLVLKNVPQMKMDDVAELRRFITLVDELYDNKVKLICLAESPLQKLFLADMNSKRDEVFAFSRTISRLEEMQTKTYLNKLHNLQKHTLCDL